ncbi:hypothetical protein GCM10022222_61650 [Amycolatopsis ultiminotia]|uniref:Uncharacterized protein n=1 Tax=Amycolatopsis ultiminotia TaxID=543629 RepID=A0ABP6XLM5_9PSEU
MTDLPTTAEGLGELAQEGAIALVGAMATGAFRAARDGIGRLFGRLGPARRARAEEQLDEEEGLVVAAGEDERDQARKALAPGWQLRLGRLLEDQPDIEAELRDLIARVQDELPEAQQHWLQTNVARDHGTVLAAQGGNVIQYHAAGKPAPPAPEDGADPQR